MEVMKSLPKLLAGNELKQALTFLPDYDDETRNKSDAERLIALSDLFNVYIPSQMSQEIYSKIYLSLIRSLQKKSTILAMQQRYENHRAILHQTQSGIIGGSDSYTIIGTSGLGKSSAISKAIDIITQNKIIEIDNPHTKIIPCLIVQCPFDSSVKGMLLEILRKADEVLDTTYYKYAVKSRTTTTDMLIGMVSAVAINHIGVLIVDEIQNVANSKNGKSLVGMLTQLINNSGISICMVGTPESAVFFEQAVQLARRSLGLRYDRLEYNQYFIDFCSTLFSYQYVAQKTEINDGIIQWLFEHSAGVTSVVVSLIHDAQEISILNGNEKLDMLSLNDAYQNRLSMLHSHIAPFPEKKTQSKKKKLNSVTIRKESTSEYTHKISIAELAEIARSENKDIVGLLKQHISVDEVCV